MRKIFFTLCLAGMALAASAMPARRGLTRTLRLADGTEVKAELRGDEFARFFQTADGKCYTLGADGLAVEADMDGIKSAAKQKRQQIDAARRNEAQRAARLGGAARVPNFNYVGPGLTTGLTGKKKGLIMLVEFPDCKFADGHDKAFYEKITNQENFSDDLFHGSVHDYYMAQSDGQFDLTFDVTQPLLAPNNHSYYGQNRGGGDARVGELVAWACEQVKDEVDFSQYDWDGDGYADQVFLLYAGYGENATSKAEDIWPHMFYLSSSDYRKEFDANGTTVDRYACSCELNTYNQPDGIGTICHEFSHCLGFNDLYDVDYSGGYGMGTWDLMDYGGYNGNGFLPCGYTGYEKWAAGWIKPVELKEDTKVEAMEAQSDNGECYLVYNDQSENEFYFLDNRQKTGWDAGLDGAGLLVTHVDFDKSVWSSNGVNDTPSHQRMSVIHADNQKGYTTRENGSKVRGYGFDAYPYVQDGVVANDSLTDTSAPAATLFNNNYDASFLMGKALLNIRQNGDGTVAFYFRGLRKSELAEGTTVFYESFDKCVSSGGNDGMWGKGGNGMFRADNDGWTSATRLYGASQCARFGSTAMDGTATTPVFRMPGRMTLTFRAAPWFADGNGHNMEVTFDGQTIFSAEMADEQWNDYTVSFTSDKEIGTLTFKGCRRFFLDEVKVVYDGKKPTGIENVTTTQGRMADGRIYTVDGRYAGRDINALAKGLYIMDGKKVVKK